MEVSEQPLLRDAAEVVEGAVDYKGQPVLRSASGGWRSALFMIGVEVAERFVYHGIGTNLITYLTGPLGQSVATAAEILNLWSGISIILTLLGAFLADSFFGRFRTIILASAIYILGLGLLTLSALLGTRNSSSVCEPASCRAPRVQTVLFFVSLYLIGLGQGGHKPCVQAFGADQFDDQSPREAKSKSSFFNWWFFGVCAGGFVSMILVTYAEESLSWSFGFGIPFVVMIIAFLVFLCGTKTYRFSVEQSENSPFLRIGRVLLPALRNWRSPTSTVVVQEEDARHYSRMACHSSEIEEAKAVLRIFPIWITLFVFSIVYAQETTFFTKQGATMDRSISSNFTIPAAALTSFVPLSVVIFLSIYDLVFVPVARSFTGITSGITTLQRIGTGLVISAISMAVAAMVERKRLRVAEVYGVVDRPEITVPMSFWWLVPQYLLFGLSDVFVMVGSQEFMYEQVPSDLKSMGLGLYTSVLGIGNILSSLLVSAIDEATGADGHTSWFSNNINKAHLDYFYFLLFGLSVLAFIVFLFVSSFHVYKH